jgi:hypothetical protein
VVLELSLQIAQEVDCMAPGTLVPFAEGGGIVFTGSAVLPYMAPAAKAALEAAAAEGGTIEINSAYRTVAQQYLLYRWYQLGRCNIAAAATPGNSNHESGRAIDVNNYAQWIDTLEQHGWSHSVPGDPVHFDHLGSPDQRGADVLAFQRLWNRNHPDDPIAEDGLYGPQTASRLEQAPAGGFASGAGPAAPPANWNAAHLGQDAPATLLAGERAEVWVELENTGGTTWRPGATFLGTTGPQDRESALYDPSTWVSPARAATVEAETPPGAVGRFAFALLAPQVAEDTAFVETFGLVEEGVIWFGPDDLTFELVVKAPGGDPVDPGDDDPPDDGDLGGGCSTTPSRPGQGRALIVLILLGIAHVIRPRRDRI